MHLVILFLLFIVLDVISVILMQSWVGSLWTVLFLLCSVFIGFIMFKNIRFSGVVFLNLIIHKKINTSFYELLWPIRFSLAVVLFIFPGFFSDLIALILILPVRWPFKIT